MKNCFFNKKCLLVEFFQVNFKSIIGYFIMKYLLLTVFVIVFIGSCLSVNEKNEMEGERKFRSGKVHQLWQKAQRVKLS